jgi:hypothetical protein
MPEQKGLFLILIYKTDGLPAGRHFGALGTDYF